MTARTNPAAFRPEQVEKRCITMASLPPSSSAPWAQPERSTDRASQRFLELEFTQAEMERVLNVVRERSPRSPFAYVVTPNVDHVVRLARTRSDLWPAYRGAWMTLCDSRILYSLARRAGCPLSVVPGSDLTAALLQEIVLPGDKVAIVGGTDACVAHIAERFGLRNVVHHNPPMGFINDPAAVGEAVRFVGAAHARYTLLAVGSPQQEILAHRIQRAGVATGLGFCVGASLNFLSGEEVRAPVLMQRLSLEWLHRLASDPARLWRRYLVECPQIFQIAGKWRESQTSH